MNVNPTWSEVLKMLRDAYNEGFCEGMNEHTHFNGGKSWDQSSACKRIDAKLDSASATLLQDGESPR